MMDVSLTSAFDIPVGPRAVMHNSSVIGFVVGGLMRRREFITLAGGTIACSLTARAQQNGRLRRVGVLMSTAETNPLETASLSAFTDGLAKLGWTAGQNVAIDVRWGAADARRLRENARELVSLEPDVLLAKGAANPAARQATSTIPIVFVVLPEAAAFAYCMISGSRIRTSDLPIVRSCRQSARTVTQSRAVDEASVMLRIARRGLTLERCLYRPQRRPPSWDSRSPTLPPRTLPI